MVRQEEACGWQVKSTREDTTVTWKRAKIPDAEALIQSSRNSAQGAQALGDAIINFCNAHARESIQRYRLEEVGYARLILHQDGRASYFERLLCTKEAPHIFQPSDFEWAWSKQKSVRRKEQLPALHGFHKATGERWWAWHGLGENQLHFTGERAWWDTMASPHAFSFQLPTQADRLSVQSFLEMLARHDASS